VACCHVHASVEDLEWHSGFFDGLARSMQLSVGADEHGDFVWSQAVGRAFPEPSRYACDFLCLRVIAPHFGIEAVEHGHCAEASLDVAVNIRHFWAEETISVRSDLVGSAVVNPQRARAPADVHAEG
jgi:hypothetical protein